jgi:hypothetical protein
VIEGVLIAVALAPVAWAVRGRVMRLALWRRVVLGGMLVLALAGQLVLSTRSFPFVDWRMYASLPHGDPTVFEYDALLRGGGRDALVPGRYMGPESADRFMEALRRQVIAGDREENAAALRVLAGMYPGHKVSEVVVYARRVSIASGAEGPRRELWRVRVP